MAFARVQKNNSLIIAGDSSPSIRKVNRNTLHEVFDSSSEALFILGNIENQLKVVTELIDRHFASAASLRPSESQSRQDESKSIASQLAVASNMKTMLSRQTATAKETLRHMESRLSRKTCEQNRVLKSNIEQESILQSRVDELRQEIFTREAYLPFSSASSEATSHVESSVCADQDFESELVSLVALRDRLLTHIEEYAEINYYKLLFLQSIF